jgi:hypothetical protein
VAIGRNGSGSSLDGSGRISLTKKISGHGLSSGRSGSSLVEFRVEHYRFFSGLGSFQVGSDFGFLLTQVISDFGSFGFGSG